MQLQKCLLRKMQQHQFEPDEYVSGAFKQAVLYCKQAVVYCSHRILMVSVIGEQMHAKCAVALCEYYLLIACFFQYVNA